MTVLVDRSLQSKTTSFHEIPVVDIAALIDNSDPERVAREIGDICENIGFLYVRNHGVPAELIREVYDLTEAFFALPFEEKERLNIVRSGPTLRGYIPMYGENVDPENTRDFKECFDLGAHQEAISPFFGPNQMPAQPARFAEVMMQYHEAMMALGRKLVSAIALSLNLPADYFEKLQTRPITIQRLLHYPPQSGEITRKEFGIGAHTDYGFLTILNQDAVGGLQVQNRVGEWVSAPPVEGTFIVNIGDLVQTFTNGRYTSTMHRVINTSGRERYSLPFFMDLDFDAVVDVVPTCISEDTPLTTRPYTCGEHKYKRFVDSYAHLQQ
ncbi:isopenicillin N synthase family dioxygenase [Marinobacterium jannaschii]|uniref:isopenicillin N synthase family dioxygenase n=1 Tax=Marinobacterium jannaschii TaxID=64970 RepID=UPI00055D3774|nr:2-oxoglutarate and iron-dependent oxygenase domain-containing protein [Marinobacterium jannaschii]